MLIYIILLGIRWIRKESFRYGKENSMWRVNTTCLFFFFYDFLSFSFSTALRQKGSAKWIVCLEETYFSYFIPAAVPSPFFITVWFEPWSWGSYSCSNVKSVWRRARELEGRERKRNARKFARLPLGMMNEPLYLFYSQISFWLLKERDARNSTRGKRAWRGLSFTIPRVLPRICRSLLLRLSVLNIHRRRVI